MEREDVLKVLKKALSYSETRELKGYDPYDALNSKMLRNLSFNSKYIRIFFTQFFKRLPINFRPLVGIPPTRNPKGIALFSMTYRNLYQITKKERYKEQKEKLDKWLIKNSQSKDNGIYWGYNFPWQNRFRLLNKKAPCCIVTHFAGEALDGKREYMDQIVQFYLTDLNVLVDEEDYLCLSYTPFEHDKIINSNALLGYQIYKFGRELKNKKYIEKGKRIINWVISKQDTDGGWFYSPDSHLGKDNFHNGYVLWALMRYWEITQNQKVLDSIKKGLKFYRSLFEDIGMPIFSNEKKYPIDIHNCSQGIITFKEAERLNLHKERFYDNILDWTIENMWDDKKHYFYYQKHRLWTNKIPYMRWSQAWMTYALSGLLLNDKLDYSGI